MHSPVIGADDGVLSQKRRRGVHVRQARGFFPRAHVFPERYSARSGCPAHPRCGLTPFGTGATLKKISAVGSTDCLSADQPLPERCYMNKFSMVRSASMLVLSAGLVAGCSYFSGDKSAKADAAGVKTAAVDPAASAAIAAAKMSIDAANGNNWIGATPRPSCSRPRTPRRRVTARKRSNWRIPPRTKLISPSSSTRSKWPNSSKRPDHRSTILPRDFPHPVPSRNGWGTDAALSVICKRGAPGGTAGRTQVPPARCRKPPASVVCSLQVRVGRCRARRGVQSPPGSEIVKTNCSKSSEASTRCFRQADFR